MSKILNHQGNIHIGAMHLHENGIISNHEAVVSQLLLIMDRTGYVCGVNKEKIKIEGDKLCFGKRESSMKQVQNTD